MFSLHVHQRSVKVSRSSPSDVHGCQAMGVIEQVTVALERRRPRFAQATCARHALSLGRGNIPWNSCSVGTEKYKSNPRKLVIGVSSHLDSHLDNVFRVCGDSLLRNLEGAIHRYQTGVWINLIITQNDGHARLLKAPSTMSSSTPPSRLTKKGDILPFPAPTWYPKTATGNTVILIACCVITAAVRYY